ncbi:MAG: LysM peptidoglycan-binding domain-containing protein [Alistipes sp.]|nr:LysM peptidoglycan-binding domain-containing protein [Alistipes sp.]
MIKKRCLLLVAALFVAISVAFATEPQVVVFNGKKYVAHTIVSGDTLYSLARTYGVTEQDILDAAKDISGETLTASQLKLGEKLFIPKKEDKKPKRSKSAYRTHIVEKGQTLYSIAKSYKISVAVLEEDNPTIDAQALKPGTELNIRRSEMGYATTEEIERVERERGATLEVGEGYHEVKPGETVYSLSRRYGLLEEEFLQLNNLSSSADLKAGMVVRVAKSTAKSETVDSPESIVADTTANDRRTIGEWFNDLFTGDEAADSVELKPVDVEFLTLGRHNRLNVALMLPFHINDKVNNNYVDFYKGVLLAMEDLKADGYSIDLSVYDTEHSAQKIKELVDYEDGLLDANLIIGPVYEDELRYVLDLAEDNNIPVVSPLADIEGVKSPVLFQMQSEDSRKYDKFSDVLDGSREVVMIYASSNDKAFAEEIKAEAKLAPMRELNFVFNRESYFYRRNADGSNGETVDIKEFMRTQTAKAFVIVADRDTDIDRILTTLSSTRASIVDRGFNVGNYMVIGNRKWSRLANIERQSFFRNNVAFLVPYHAKRSDRAIRIFDGRYIAAYNTLPSMYSYRGYDAAMIFCRKMYEGFGEGFENESFMPLTTLYRFKYEDGIYVNTEWTLEQYTDHFRIEIR